MGKSFARRRTWCWLAMAGLCALFTLQVHASSPQPHAMEPLVELGQYIFNDKDLSGARDTSCATCHRPEKKFSDGQRVAIGTRHLLGTRNTPSLLPSGLKGTDAFFWDGRRTTLQSAVLDPFVNPVEMGLTSHEELISRLVVSGEYRRLVSRAYPGTERAPSLAQVASALSTYIRSLDKQPSDFERFGHMGESSALSAQAQRGLGIFKGKGQCAECHVLNGTPVPFTDHLYHRTGIGLGDVEARLGELTVGVMQRSLSGEALGVRIATHLDESQLGRFNVTHRVEDIGLFRTPSLIGVSATAPYMHDGSVATLEEALDNEIYYRSLTSARPIGLTSEERADLLAFLRSI